MCNFLIFAINIFCWKFRTYCWRFTKAVREYYFYYSIVEVIIQWLISNRTSSGYWPINWKKKLVRLGNSFCFLFSKFCFWEYKKKFLYFWNQKHVWLIEIKKIFLKKKIENTKKDSLLFLFLFFVFWLKINNNLQS